MGSWLEYAAREWAGARKLVLTKGSGVRWIAMCALIAGAGSARAANYSMGCVDQYSSAGFPAAADLKFACDATSTFSAWFNLSGQHSLVRYWKNTLVWPSDYREDSLGGMDEVESDWSGSDLQVFSGNGSCQPPPANAPDFILTARASLSPGANFVDIRSSLRLGEFPGSGVFGSNGNLNALLLDASCSMDLASLTTQWWPVFQGLHLAMGHSGDQAHFTLDSAARLATVGMYLGYLNTSYNTAWMSAGLTDVLPGACAVITAAGRTQAEAIDRRDFETPTARTPDGLPASWIAWRWVCK